MNQYLRSRQFVLEKLVYNLQKRKIEALTALDTSSGAPALMAKFVRTGPGLEFEHILCCGGIVHYLSLDEAFSLDRIHSDSLFDQARHLYSDQ